jgi:transposase-like protein
MTTRPTNSSLLDEAASTASATTTESTGQTETGPKRVFPSRKLSDDQEREVTRLYAETATSQAEIARRFGIGQTSVARIAQRHGAPLRTPGLTRASANGTPVPSEAAPAPSRPAEAEVRPTEPAATARPAPVGGPWPDEAPTRRRRSAVKHAGAARVAPRAGSAAASLRPATGAANGTRRRFRITFVAEQVIKARTILDALRQAEARGATDVTSITRAD